MQGFRGELGPQRGYSSDFALTIREMNVAVRAMENTPQPPGKITRSLLAIIRTPKHKCSETQDRRHPKPHEHSLLLVVSEPQRNGKKEPSTSSEHEARFSPLFRVHDPVSLANIQRHATIKSFITFVYPREG